MQGVPTPNSSAIRRRDNAADGVSPPRRGVQWFFNGLLKQIVRYANREHLLDLYLAADVLVKQKDPLEVDLQP